MKRKQLIAVCLMLMLSLSLTAGIMHPKFKAVCFAAAHSKALEQRIESKSGMPEGIGIISFNEWNGTHPMTEFVLSRIGGTLCGCYYSPDDVPRTFQNEDAPLKPKGKGWKWNGKMRSGTTYRLRENWFYFEVKTNQKKGVIL